MQRPIRKAFLCTTMVFLAGCATQDITTAATKDIYAVQLMEAGDATCMATQPADNIAAAAASNQLRRAAGLPVLVPDATLARAAAQHACDMARRGRMTHIGSATSGPSQRVKALGYRPVMTAENIAAGPFTREQVLQEWNNSPSHRDNILILQMREVGIGHAIAADGKTRFWAAVYSASR